MIQYSLVKKNEKKSITTRQTIPVLKYPSNLKINNWLNWFSKNSKIYQYYPNALSSWPKFIYLIWRVVD
jgi:hypothetical protein